MRTQLLWGDQVPEADGAKAKPVVWDLAYRPDGGLLVAAVGRQLIVYDANDGKILKTRNAHATDVYSISCSRDGGFVASGGADKAVSVWTYDLAQKYTYSHSESVQVVAFNPVTHNVLLSCSCVDFAIWAMPSAKMSPKVKVPAKVLCASWTSDGQYFALGLMNGAISLRDATGGEKLTFSRSAPVWDLCWLPSRAEADPYDTLAVACWDATLSLYQLTGQQIGRDRALDFDPCSVRPLPGGDFLVVAGSDRKAVLFTRDGVRLSTAGEAKDWIWRALPRPSTAGAPAIALASNDGSISVHSVLFSTVHSLYQDRYAFRENMTDLVVQHLVSEQRVRIKCRDYVKKVAIYRDRLAVQLSDRIVVYELTPDAAAPAGAVVSGVAVDAAAAAAAAAAADATSALVSSSTPSLSSSTLDAAAAASAALGGASGGGTTTSIMYRVKDRIIAQLDCNLLVVTSTHLILCLDKKLQLFDFGGTKEREWVLEAVIRYIKVVGGPPGREGLLVGLKNGVVLKIYSDNPFPMQLVKHKLGIRCLDLSMSRRKIAVVDEGNNCVVYDLVSGELLFSETGANSVAWNSQMEDMLCFSGGGVLSIKTGAFPLHQQKLAGFVVGFSGSKIFCLQSVVMTTIDVPQSASLYRYVEEKDWELGYRVACLGVTDSDWRMLGDAALRSLQLVVARAAFVRLRDMRYIELINHIESSRRTQAAAQLQLAAGPAVGAARGRQAAAAAAAAAARPQPQGGKEEENAQYLAEVMAYAGRYQEAAKLHVKAGTIEKAVEMFTDMRLWSEARRFAEESGRVDVSALMLKQAAWCEDSGDVAAAATIYSGLGMASRAVQLLGERGLFAQLVDLVRTLPSASVGGGNGVGAGAGSGGGASGGDAGAGTGAGAGDDGLSQDVRAALLAAGDAFRKADLVRHAREAFLKLGDVRQLLRLHLDLLEWDEALALVARTEAEDRAAAGGSAVARNAAAATARALAAYVHLARAEWLATEDRFEEAQRYYEAGGRPDLSARILEQLAASALEEDRYEDASACYLRLARDSFAAIDRAAQAAGAAAAAVELAAAAGEPPSAAAASAAALAAQQRRLRLLVPRYRQCQHAADVYRAYGLVHASVAAPFTASTAEAVLQSARFVLAACLGATRPRGHALGQGQGQGCGRGQGASADDAAAEETEADAADAEAETEAEIAAAPAYTGAGRRLPYRVSLMRTLYALARQCVALHAFKTARLALGELEGMLVPRPWRDAVDLMAMKAHGKPVADPETVVPTCFRCGAAAPLLVAAAGALTQPPTPRPRLALYRAAASRAASALQLLPARGRGGVAAGAGAAASAAVSPASSAPPGGGGEEGGDDGSGAGLDELSLAVDTAFSSTRCSGDICAACGHAVVRSALTFEPLPLVEFVPVYGADVPDLEAALRMLGTGPAPGAVTAGGGGTGTGAGAGSGAGAQAQAHTRGNVQTLSLGGALRAGTAAAAVPTPPSGDAAFRALVTAEEGAALSSASSAALARAHGGPSGAAVRVPARVLRLLEPRSVFVQRALPGGSAGGSTGGAGDLALAAAEGGGGAASGLSGGASLLLRPRLFFNLVPEIGLSLSACCGRFFHTEDLELECLKQGRCPCCGGDADGDGGGGGLAAE